MKTTVIVVVPGDWRNEGNVCDGLQSTQKLGSNNHPKSAKDVHDRFKNYFCSPKGALKWQLEKVTRTYNQQKTGKVYYYFSLTLQNLKGNLLMTVLEVLLLR